MRRTHSLFLPFSLALISLTVAATSAHAKPKLGVIGLEAIDSGSSDSQKATASLAKWLTRGLRARASHARSQYSVASDANKEFSEVRLDVGCWEDNLDCMVQIGKSLKTDQLLYGKLEKKENQYFLTLKLLNVETKSYENKKTNVFPESEGTKKKAKTMAKSLFAEITGIPYGGTLVVRTNVDTGTVLIDGKPKGTIVGGEAKINGLDGTVAVSVESPGYTRWDGEATVRDGKVRRINAKLSVRKTDALPDDGVDKIDIPVEGDIQGDGLQKWRVMSWTGAAVTASGMVAILVSYNSYRSYETKKENAITASFATNQKVTNVQDACTQASSFSPAAGTPAADVVAACDAGKAGATRTNILWGATSAVAAATLFFVYKAYLQTPTTTGVDQARANGPSIIVLPTVSPDGAGVGAIIRF